MVEVFLLGKAENPKHIEILEELAYWLDQNKFSCTFSIVERFAMFDVEPWPENKQHYKNNEFKDYASEIIIHQLNKTIEKVLVDYSSSN